MALGLNPVLLLLSSSALVGLTLGLIGGGAQSSLFLVGVPSAHVAIGSSAVAVALNAASGLAGSVIGTQVNVGLAGHKRALAVTFAGVVIAVGVYVVASGVAQLFATG